MIKAPITGNPGNVQLIRCKTLRKSPTMKPAPAQLKSFKAILGAFAITWRSSERLGVFRGEAAEVESGLEVGF